MANAMMNVEVFYIDGLYWPLTTRELLVHLYRWVTGQEPPPRRPRECIRWREADGHEYWRPMICPP